MLAASTVTNLTTPPRINAHSRAPERTPRCRSHGLERMSVVDVLRRLSAPEGDPFSEPAGEPRLVDVACGDGEHCVDSLVGVGL